MAATEATSTAGAVAGGIHTRDVRPRHRSTVTNPRSSTATPASSRPRPRIRHRTDRHQRVAAGDLAAVGEADDHAVAFTAHRRGPGFRQDLHSAPGEYLLQQRRGVGVLAGSTRSRLDTSVTRTPFRCTRWRIRRRSPQSRSRSNAPAAAADRKPGATSAPAHRRARNRGRIRGVARSRPAPRRRGPSARTRCGRDLNAMRAAIGLGRLKRARPLRTVTPSRVSRSRTSADCALARPLTRPCTTGRRPPPRPDRRPAHRAPPRPGTPSSSRWSR